MGNIDDSAISSLLDKIGKMRDELDALENEVKSLGTSSQDDDIPVEVMEDLPQEPIDISIPDVGLTDIPASISAPAFEPAETPVPTMERETGSAAKTEPDQSQVEPEPIVVPSAPEPIEVGQFEAFQNNEEPAPSHSKKKVAVLDSKKADRAVMDVMAEKQAWRSDLPGSQVKNIISAISLNDRVLLINVLFKEDPMLFQDTIAKFNGMSSLDEAVSFINEQFPDWDLNSEPVYRLMMAVRRKLS